MIKLDGQYLSEAEFNKKLQESLNNGIKIKAIVEGKEYRTLKKLHS